MNIWVLLTLLSVVGGAALFIALALFLGAITTELETIGGEPADYGAKSSYLSKIRMGVRAIEVQTGALPVQVARLNQGLSAICEGVKAIDGNLGGVIAAVKRQEAS